jgi:ankyrin repeat protein
MTDFPKLPRIKQDDENMEKLHCAARRGQADLVRRLVTSGVDPSIENKFGCTALHLACKFGQVGATRELVKTAKDLSGLWHGQRPLHLAAKRGNAEVLALLIDAAREQGKDVAGFVNECDEYETFEFAGQNKHVQGQTALHYCVGERNDEVIKVLLALGASPTAKDKNGETPLMRCIEYNLTAEFNLLLSIPNLRLDISDRQGRTHLHWALARNRPEMAKRLLEAGHEATAEDQDKVTPWLLAACAGQVALADTMMTDLENFTIQQAGFHNGMNVIPDRIQWLPFVTDDAVKTDVIKVLQKRLDNAMKGVAAPAQTNARKGAQGPMTVAPSAPVKRG